MCIGGEYMAEKGINLQIAEFQDNLAKLINESNLPVRIKRMSVGEAYSQLINYDNRTVAVERQAYLKAVKEEQDEFISNKNTMAE
jgi:hypothetical protein